MGKRYKQGRPVRVNESRAKALEAGLETAFGIFRPLDIEQAAEIRRDVRKIVKGIPGVHIRGQHDAATGIHVLGKFETKDLPIRGLVDDETIVRTLFRAAPTLSEPNTSDFGNVGRFNKTSATWVEIAASFGGDDEFHVAERGDVQAGLSELCGWEPVDLVRRTTRIPLIGLPGDLDDRSITYVQTATWDIMPEKLIFDSAKVIF